MADRRTAEVIGVPDAPPLLTLTKGSSAVAFAIVTSLIVATAVVEDRRSADDGGLRRVTQFASPTPRPSRSPERITAEQAESRRRAVLNTVRFTAGLVCPDSADFTYQIRRTTSDVVETVVDAFDPQHVDGIVVKVTLLPGGIAYLVEEEQGSCDA